MYKNEYTNLNRNVLSETNFMVNTFHLQFYSVLQFNSAYAMK